LNLEQLTISELDLFDADFDCGSRDSEFPAIDFEPALESVEPSTKVVSFRLGRKDE
jgi:hypothetical protein